MPMVPKCGLVCRFARPVKMGYLTKLSHKRHHLLHTGCVFFYVQIKMLTPLGTLSELKHIMLQCINNLIQEQDN